MTNVTIEKLKPLAGTLIVEYEDRATAAQRATDFLLATPKFQGVPNSGVVKAVGDDINDVEVGEYILFAAGMKPEAFKLGGVGYFVLKHNQILAVDRRTKAE